MVQTYKNSKCTFKKIKTHSCSSTGEILKQFVEVMILKQFIVRLGLRLSSPISCMYVLKTNVAPIPLNVCFLTRNHGNYIYIYKHLSLVFLTWVSCIIYINIFNINLWYIQQHPINCVGILVALLLGLLANSIPKWYFVESLSYWTNA